MELSQGKTVDSTAFQKMIDGNFGSGNATGTIGGGNYIITITRNGTNYKMSSSGKLETLDELPIDFEPGVLEKSGNTYTINSIEDLVAFSYNVNSGTELYTGKTVTLGRNLDFKGSKDSYVDENAKYKKDEFGYTPDDTSSTTIKSYMTDTNGEGFYPVGGKTYDIAFAGNFDGKNKSLSNLFISSEFKYVAFIGQSKGDTIANLKILNCNLSSSSAGIMAGIVGYCNEVKKIDNCSTSGNISCSSQVGGIVGATGSVVTITNCYNDAIVTGNYQTGGIHGAGGVLNIINCYNNGKVLSNNNNAGGISGNAGEQIINCYNNGDIKGSDGSIVGGILPLNGGTVKNCYNFKSVIGGTVVGGIISQGYAQTVLDNCYNIGTIKEIQGAPIGGILGYGSTTTNCHNTGTIIGKNSSYVGEITGGSTVDDTNDYLLKTDNEGNSINANANGATGKTQAEMDEIMSVQGFVNLMNTYVAENNADSSKTKLKTWKIENGFPVFAE